MINFLEIGENVGFYNFFESKIGNRLGRFFDYDLSDLFFLLLYTLKTNCRVGFV